MPLILTSLLGTSFCLTGIGTLFFPLTTARLFGMAAVPSTVFTTRMLGARDLVLGIGLFKVAGASNEQEHAVLYAINVINAIDTLSALASYAEGNLPGQAFVTLETAAAMLLGLGLLEIRRL